MKLPAPRRRWNALTIEWKLPLLMTAVLVVVLATSLALTYGTLTNNSERNTRERLDRAAEGIAASAAGTIGQRLDQLEELSRDAEVHEILRQSRMGTIDPILADRVRSSLGSEIPSADSLHPIELWSSEGRRLLVSGPELPERMEIRFAHGQLTSSAFGDTTRWVGPLHREDGYGHFWVSVPVGVGAQATGFLVQRRRIGGPRDAVSQISALIGESVDMFMRSADDSLWVTPGGLETASSRHVSDDDDSYAERAGVGRVLRSEHQIAQSSMVVVLESPLSVIHVRTRRALLQLAALSVLLAGIGAVLAWGISRRITRPLSELASAAESLGRGEYVTGSHPVIGSGEPRDEMGRLEASFEHMALEIESSRRDQERRIEEAQAAANALERANAQLQEAMREADRANLAKSDFLAMMSHELRTPLNAIGGYTQLLELEVHGPITEAQREALERIERSHAHLLRLINDVLNFARLDAGQVRYDLADVPVDRALAELEPLVAPQLMSRRLVYRCSATDPHLTVHADVDKLQQIVLNLLTNAMKFTPEGGEVALECEPREREVLIHVRDDGIGVPADRLETIFDPFVQVNRSLSRPHEGVGLGLAISRDLARGMGGDLKVRSQVGKGSVFTVILPRFADAPLARPSTALHAVS